tara:strand:- start:4164 stop:4298 length:135 start_codon:yes stop_codon:yes gene_type:complete
MSGIFSRLPLAVATSLRGDLYWGCAVVALLKVSVNAIAALVLTG